MFIDFRIIYNVFVLNLRLQTNKVTLKRFIDLYLVTIIPKVCEFGYIFYQPIFNLIQILGERSLYYFMHNDLKMNAWHILLSYNRFLHTAVKHNWKCTDLSYQVIINISFQLLITNYNTISTCIEATFPTWR